MFERQDTRKGGRGGAKVNDYRRERLTGSASTRAKPAPAIRFPSQLTEEVVDGVQLGN